MSAVEIVCPHCSAGLRGAEYDDHVISCAQIEAGVSLAALDAQEGHVTSQEALEAKAGKLPWSGSAAVVPLGDCPECAYPLRVEQRASGDVAVCARCGHTHLR